MYVKLISSDGHEFIVKRDHALTSGTIKAMLSGPGPLHEQFHGNPRISDRAGDRVGVAYGRQLLGLLINSFFRFVVIILDCYFLASRVVYFLNPRLQPPALSRFANSRRGLREGFCNADNSRQFFVASVSD